MTIACIVDLPNIGWRQRQQGAGQAVFTQGTIWQIDSFDQWGVELGKALAQRIIPQLDSVTESALKRDSSANALIRRYRKLKASA